MLHILKKNIKLNWQIIKYSFTDGGLYEFLKKNSRNYRSCFKLII